MKSSFVALAALVTSVPISAAPPTALTVSDSKYWLHTLADDTAAGRRTGSAAQLRIGDWLAGEFRQLALLPLPAQRDYFQYFQFSTEQNQTVIGRNVLAVIPGSAPVEQAEYLLISAHYDHVGSKADASRDHVFNGADDNASGVTALLGIAKELQAHIARTGQRPSRHIVFAAWDAEEMGLKGSHHFVDQPLLPLARIVSNLNFEMLGVTEGKNRRNLWMTGWQHSDLFDTLQPVLATHGWKLESDPYPDWKLFLRSDNAPFAAMKNIGSEAEPHWLGIPAHSLSVWRGQSHYHGKHDEAGLIDLDNLTELAAVMSKVVLVLADSSQSIAWKENGSERFSRLQESDGSTMSGSP